jgi:hypothetical protein
MSGKRVTVAAAVVAGVVVAMTAGLSSSTGQTPDAPGLTYGGQKDDYAAWLRLVPGREAIAALQMDWAIAPERCSNRRVYSSILYAGSEEFELIRVSQAGKFKKTVVDRYREEGSRFEETQTVQGTISGDVATGSISGRVRIVRPNGQVVRCNFGPQGWRLVD